MSRTQSGALAALIVSAAFVPFAALATPDAASPPASAAPVDPELAAITAASPTPGPQPAGTWTETATRDYYNGDINLAWQHTLGDYSPTPIASVVIPDLNQRTTIKINVTGNDFYVRNEGGGSATFDAREGPSGYRPTLVVNGRTKYQATRDTALSTSTSNSLGTSPLMKDTNAMLIAFDGYTPQIGDRAVLQLVTEKQFNAHRVTVYRPLIKSVFPSIDAPAIGTTIADFRPSKFKTSATIVDNGQYVTGHWGGTSGTAFSQVFPLPPGTDYFLTVVIRLHDDWTDKGGKLPGLSDTGLATNTGGTPLSVNGVNCTNSGWGGRGANGCRWSARTGWGGRSGNQIGLHSYFYAQQPSSAWGVEQNWPTPAPVGQWIAYVERVKLNTPGHGDGRLSYWLCTLQGCAPQVDKGSITWSSYDIAQAKITEAWADVYCGGTSCGPAPWPNSTTDIARMTVTTGLPDLNKLLAEVQTQNATVH